ncbi:MAG TPA: PIN domain-containing protein [Tepidisphaeraceae bacterium]|jgi:predicted nucleic acid-binding protein|nr:PIN domain-containing protein [Tepidisphaeraceae bacterium]
MIVLDTNIWIYCHDKRDPRKQAIAQELVSSATPLLLIWQIGCEFIAAARKLSNEGFSETNAWDALEDMRQMADAISLPDLADWAMARSLQTTDNLSFWDAMLVASCQRSQTIKLYTEDMGSPRRIGTLDLINPFL